MFKVIFSNRVPRILIVAGFVAVAGVSIDLITQPQASASAMNGHAISSKSMGESVAMNAPDETTLLPGASIGAYDIELSDSETANRPAKADESTLESGASIAAYGND
jgi:hypothetical protein